MLGLPGAGLHTLGKYMERHYNVVVISIPHLLLEAAAISPGLQTPIDRARLPILVDYTTKVSLLTRAHHTSIHTQSFLSQHGVHVIPNRPLWLLHLV